MTKFLLARHATTNAVGKHLSGRTPGVYLNDEGLQQARELSFRLEKVPVTAIYSSPMERALETARPVAESHGLNCLVDHHFTEMDFGLWTNRSFEDLAHDPDFKLFNIFRSHSRVPGGELMLEAQTRIVTGIENLCKLHPDGTIAVFSHADLIKAAIAYYAGITLDMFQRIEISPASVSVIEIYPDNARITCINHTGKL